MQLGFLIGVGGGIFRPTTTIMLREGLNQTPKFFTRKTSFLFVVQSKLVYTNRITAEGSSQSPGDLCDFW